jgi:hypothetical protein
MGGMKITLSAQSAPADVAAALKDLRDFTAGHLTGERREPFLSSPEGARYQKGAAGRILTGALNSVGTAGMIGGGSLPDIGELDLAPAMAMAAFEADYWIRSYGTLIGWHLGAEVYNMPPEGEWILVSQRCNDDYGRFSKTTTRHQNLIEAAVKLLDG